MYSTLFAAARRPLSFAVSLLLSAAPAFAQQAQSPAVSPPQDEDEVVRVSAELVQTDVMVFDRDGRFVEGLTPEQFELKVDGQTQPVAFFERIEAGTINEDAQLAAARGGARSTQLPTGVALPLDRGRTVAFFVDDLHLSPEGAARTRQTLQKFIEQELGQNDVAAVSSASGKVGFLQQYTGHKAVLRAAVERITAGPAKSLDNERPAMSEVQAAAVERNDMSIISALVQALLRDNPGGLMTPETADSIIRGRARSLMERAGQMTTLTLQALESTVRRSGPLPGRKIIFFISEGFIFDERNGQVRDRLRRVTDAAARAGVVIYTMDAQGLRTSTPDASVSARPYDPTMALASSELGEVTAYQTPLYTLASETGGRALVNSNALAAGVLGALKETAKYYLLAWRPAAAEGKGGPKFRRIEVAVKGRSDLRVLVRRGFYSTPPEPLSAPQKKKDKEKREEAAQPQNVAPTERALQTALYAPHPRAELPTAIALGYANTAQAGSLLTSSIELNREAVIHLTEGSSERHHFDILGVVFDMDGKAVKGFKQELSFAGQLGDAPDRTRLVTTYQTAVPPGLYQVRVATRDRKSGRTGSIAEWVQIPDFKREKFALGSVFLAERPAVNEAAKPTNDAGAAESAAPPEAQATSHICADRRFARTSWLRFLTHIYNPAAATSAASDLALQVQVFRDDQPVYTAPLLKVKAEGLTDLTRVPYAAEIGLSNFPAGRYVLQLTAIDRASKQTATQRVNFAIE
jgi:VWFA-related protein